MYICNIGRRLFTPTIVIIGIKAGSSHLSFAEIILFYFPKSIIFTPHKVTIYITDCIAWCLKFIVINSLINASSSLVVLITISPHKVSEVSGLSTRSLPSWCLEVSSLYSSSSLVFFVSFALAIESSQLVCDLSYFSYREVSIASGLW